MREIPLGKMRERDVMTFLPSATTNLRGMNKGFIRGNFTHRPSCSIRGAGQNPQVHAYHCYALIFPIEQKESFCSIGVQSLAGKEEILLAK
jgi:hypothetical protein